MWRTGPKLANWTRMTHTRKGCVEWSSVRGPLDAFPAGCRNDEERLHTQHMTQTGDSTPSDDAETENSSDRTKYDGRTVAGLKRLSREHGPLVARGWLFEDGDQHPLPPEAGGERR